jgi:hypothetical protein
MLESKPNYYVRTLIVLLGLLILAMAYISFFLAEPKHQITTGIITLISIVVILVLSESFNKLSVGKILNLSREIEKKEKESVAVKSENKELRQELFKIVSNVQQSQVNNTFNTPPEAWLKMLGVVKAENDDEDADDEDTEQSVPSEVSSREKEREESRAKSRLRRYAVDAGFHNFVSKQSFDSKFVDRVEFSSAFHAIDPIMDRRIVFDGYMKQGDAEVFLEARHSDMVSMMYFDRLYIMLSKISLYKEAKNTNAELLLLIVETEWTEKSPRGSLHERLLNYFQPAIKNGLLRVESISVTEKEALEQESGDQRKLL